MNDRDVFINCPFTDDYQQKYWAIIFTIIRSGFVPRCSRESDDGAEVRIDKICRIIAECRYGVHDISKTELDEGSHLPRFNMPLELGIFLGAKKWGQGQLAKKTMILDRDQYRYQQFISDISGQDIHSHNNELGRLIEKISAWLRDEARDPNVPGGRAIAAEFINFSNALPLIAHSKQLDVDELTFKDLVAIASGWIVT